MFQEIKGDITKVEADVIINAANTELKHDGGVARAIAQAAGNELTATSEEIGYVPLGDFAVTLAGNLQAKEVCHIPTICYKTGQKADLDIIAKSLEKVLSYVQKKGYRSVATPLLGAGVVGLPEDEVRDIIKKVAEKYPDLNIYLVLKR